MKNYNVKYKIVLIGFIVLILTNACNLRIHKINTNDIRNDFQPLLVKKYTSDSIYYGLIDGFTIPVISLKFKKLFDWIENNKKGWQKSPSNFVSLDWNPPQLVLSNSNFEFLIYRDFITLSYSTKKGQKRTLTKTITKNEFRFLNDKY